MEIDNDDLVDIADMCHEVNRAYCQLLGDMSQLPWKDAPQWQKDSAINGVKFHLANPNSKPSDSHDSWLKEKLEQGWKYGPVKDIEKKEHPCITSYGALPEQQKLKDVLFLCVVRAADNHCKENP